MENALSDSRESNGSEPRESKGNVLPKFACLTPLPDLNELFDDGIVVGRCGSFTFFVVPITRFTLARLAMSVPASRNIMRGVRLFSPPLDGRWSCCMRRRTSIVTTL